jgi:hypothetical protein
MDSEVIVITYKTLKGPKADLSKNDKKAMEKYLNGYRSGLENKDFYRALFAKRMLYESFGVIVSARLNGKPITASL